MHPFKNIVLLLLLVIVPVIGAEKLPARPQGPVADIAGIIDDAAEVSITQICRALWEQAGFALVVATLPSLDGIPIEEYAVKLYEAWGIGKAGKDEGVLVLLSLDPRRCRIEVGYGSEGYLNDAKTGRILDEFGFPYFKTGAYSQGMLALCGAVAQVVEQEKGVSLAVSNQVPHPMVEESARRISPLGMVVIIIILAIMMSTRFGRAMLFWMLMSSLAGGRRGGFGGGFGSGGFGGGFGGGRSGGGGASGMF